MKKISIFRAMGIDGGRISKLEFAPEKLEVCEECMHSQLERWLVKEII